MEKNMSKFDMNELLLEFNGFDSNTIFCMWTGDSHMSTNRIQSLWSIINNVNCPLVYINKHSIKNWIHPNYPLHPAFEFLSDTHKSDYLRCYLMHHYGGGYTDIKHTTQNWIDFFIKLKKSDKLALGYQELAHGIPHLISDLGDEIRNNYESVIGLCSFIFKPNSIITNEWISSTNSLLNDKFNELKNHPARHPQDQNEAILPDGSVSMYPLRWAELLGEIFHPIIYKYNQDLIQDLISPQFSNYR
jgi:hypothetical protein